MTSSIMSDTPNASSLIDFIGYVDKLKSVIRKNALHDNSRAENTAEHSWHAALSAIILAPYANNPVDIHKVTRMLLIHDLVEIEAGDTSVYDKDKVAEQELAESHAADIVFNHLPEELADDLRKLWEEFETRQTPEAKYAKAIDRFLPLLSNIKNEGFSWQPLDITAKEVREVCSLIRDGSIKLWQQADKMIDEAVEEGFLQPG
ncbi:MAG: HD domain-containing protein [Chloroflexota bacterium]|nr:HD domain-containing protein [Chloroflexota bacterium]